MTIPTNKTWNCHKSSLFNKIHPIRRYNLQLERRENSNAVHPNQVHIQWKIMKKFFIQRFMAFNTFLIRASKGRLGSKLGGQTVLILHTTGRKSGQPRAVPISYFRDGKNFFVIGSNWAQEKHASWYFNVKDNPRAALEVSGEKIPVLAHEAAGEEYARLWQIAVERYPSYQDYKKNVERHIPIIIFEPIS
jgi:deazaflavin-dependent oxidoreductase (nitroreductase family)